MTAGRIVDYGIKDSMNMGACMAPAAADTLTAYLNDTGEDAESFDKIITGDLGYIGQKILIDLMRKKNIDISLQHTDCGIEIYDKETQDTHAGGSGCGCSAVDADVMDFAADAFGENGGGYFSCLQARFFHRSALMKVRVCRALLTALSLRLVYEHKRYLKKYETCQRAVLNAFSGQLFYLFHICITH